MYYIQIHYAWLGLLLGITACLITASAYPLVLRMARVWNFYDNPDARKLQRKPIPVLGGMAVYVGMLVTMALFMTVFPLQKYFLILYAITALLIIGVWDDKRNLPVLFRFLVEIVTVSALAYFGKGVICDLGGLCGIYDIPVYAGWALSVFAGVGVINAINLIDGVDGYLSGYTIMVCLLFSGIFYYSHVYSMGIICLIGVGAMLPFFLHNVFGVKTKMFIGDGGTLMMGTLIVGLLFSMLKKSSLCIANLQAAHEMGLIPLALAILSVAVFDTIRVMCSRILRGTSPFHPDKTHLHHLFIDMKFSHLGTTVFILAMDLFVVLAWLASWFLGASVTLQLYIVLFTGCLCTFAFYPFMRWQEKHHGFFYLYMCKMGSRTHLEHTKWWQWMRKFIDDELFSEGKCV